MKKHLLYCCDPVDPDHLQRQFTGLSCPHRIYREQHHLWCRADQSRNGMLPGPAGSFASGKIRRRLHFVQFRNFSRTMLKHGDYPIWNGVEFRNAWKFTPDILLICLGTNDSKPQNWDLLRLEFYDDYRSMIDTFRVGNPHVQYLVCHPCPAYRVVSGNP